MNPELSYLIAANSIIQDAQTSKFTLVDTFAVFILPADQPFVLQSFAVLGRIFNLQKGPVNVDVKIFGPDGSLLQTSSVDADIKAGDLTFAVRFNLVKVDSLGKYVLKAAINGTDLADAGRYFLISARP